MTGLTPGCRERRPARAQERLPRLLAAAGTSAIATADAIPSGRQHDRPHGGAGTLSLHAVPERQAAIDDFYRRYAGDPLIIVQWLSLQAAIPEADPRSRSRTHPACGISLGNPNRVRALIGGFCAGEPDPVNRRMAPATTSWPKPCLRSTRETRRSPARMTTAFRSWRALEPVRRGRAEAALRRIAAEQTLSRT